MPAPQTLTEVVFLVQIMFVSSLILFYVYFRIVPSLRGGSDER